jgi:hypothetical protein
MFIDHVAFPGFNEFRSSVRRHVSLLTELGVVKFYATRFYKTPTEQNH